MNERQRRRARRQAGGLVIHVVLILGAGFMLLPMLWITSLRRLDPTSPFSMDERSGAAGTELSSAVLTIWVGMDRGATISVGRGVLTGAVVRCPRTGCSAATGVKDAGAVSCNHRTCGGPPTQNSEMASSKLKAKACIVKLARVVHPRRRADWSHVLSSVLNILVSSRTGPLPVQTPAGSDLIPTRGEGAKKQIGLLPGRRSTESSKKKTASVTRSRKDSNSGTETSPSGVATVSAGRSKSVSESPVSRASVPEFRRRAPVPLIGRYRLPRWAR